MSSTKVWVVLWSAPYEGSSLEGVFSTKEKGDAYAAKRNGEFGDSYHVEEITVDEEREA